MELTENAKKLLQQRYFVSKDDSWEKLVKRLVERVNIRETKEYKQSVYENIKNLVWLPNSPALATSGNKKFNGFACFVAGPNEDTLENHLETLADIAQVAKHGGGCGFTGTFIRPENSPVNGSAHGYAYGPNKWAKSVSSYMDMMTQAGFRKMALMYTLSSEHADLEKFIDLKQTNNEKDLYNFNQSVFATDKWMKGATENKFSNEYRLLLKLCYNAWNNGDPGLLFSDTINNYTPYKYSNQAIYATNPCFAPDTLIHTKNGHFQIKDLVNKQVDVWDGNNWIQIDNFRVTGQNQPILKIELQDGSILKVTPYHKMILENGKIVEAHKLKKDDKLIISNAPTTHGNISAKAAYLKGFLLGDGTYQRIQPRLWLYEPKYMCESKLIESYNEITEKISNTNSTETVDFIKILDRNAKNMRGLTVVKNELFDWVTIYKTELPKEIFEWDLKSKCEFISGLFDADGCALDTTSGFGYQITSTSKQLLLDLQNLLKTIGVFSKVSKERNETYKDFNDGYGEYYCKSIYRLTIAQKNSIKLSEQVKFTRLVSFENKTVTYNVKPKFNKIVKIEQDENEELVYCCTVDTTHQIALTSGIATGQCGEVPLPQFGACNLSSINLSHPKFLTNNNQFNYTELSQIVMQMVRFMDNIGDVNIFPNEKFANWYKNNRPIGIGIMGFADLLLKLGIKYGEQESLNILNDIMSCIQNSSYLESHKLGKERGIPLNCQYPEINRRNITTVSIAPTGSIAFIAGCSHGIEPIFSPTYTRIDERGQKYIVEHEKAHEPYFVATVDCDNIPTWKQHIDIQATAQKWCDSGISKTINMEENITVEDVYNAIIYAWQKNCKGITIYRNNSRQMQVLNSNSNQNKKENQEFLNCDNCGEKMITIEGCSTCLSCGNSLCST